MIDKNKLILFGKKYKIHEVFLSGFGWMKRYQKNNNYRSFAWVDIYFLDPYFRSLYQVQSKTLPSLPVLKIQGCLGWKTIFLTPSMLLTECPLNTLSGIMTASCMISVLFLKWKTWMVASLEDEAIKGYSLWNVNAVIAFSWNCIVL